MLSILTGFQNLLGIDSNIKKGLDLTGFKNLSGLYKNINKYMITLRLSLVFQFIVFIT